MSDVKFCGRLKPSGFELYATDALVVTGVDPDAKVISLNRKPESVEDLIVALRDYLKVDPVCELHDIIVEA